MRATRAAVLGLVVAAWAYAPAPPAAQAASGPWVYENKAHGFTTKLPGSFKAVPPKPTKEAKSLAAEFYDDMAKYASSGATNPEFKITWWSTVRDEVTGGGENAKKQDGPADIDMEEAMGIKSLDDAVDRLIEQNTNLFGSTKPPMAERWAAAKTGKTAKGKLDFQYLDINDPAKAKKGDTAKWYLFVAKLKLNQDVIDTAFKGIDLDQLYKEWMNFAP